MEFASIEKFPLDLIPRLQTDRGRQGQWEADVESWILSARTDRLDTQRIGNLHFSESD